MGTGQIGEVGMGRVIGQSLNWCNCRISLGSKFFGTHNKCFKSKSFHIGKFFCPKQTHDVLGTKNVLHIILLGLKIFNKSEFLSNFTLESSMIKMKAFTWNSTCFKYYLVCQNLQISSSF